MNTEAARDIVVAGIDRLCIEAVGSDAATYLHSQLSNDISSMGVGESRYAFALEPTGKIIALVRVTRLSDSAFLLDTDAVPGLDEILLGRLNRFKIRVAVDFSAGVRKCAAIRVRGAGTVPVSSRAAIETSTGAIVADAWWQDGRALDVIPRTDQAVVDATMIAESVDGSRVSSDPFADVEEARVRDAWPAMGSEIIPATTLVAATGLTSRAVSFTKGCYPGQELVERMDSRGSNAPHSLRRFAARDLHGAGTGGIVVGDPIMVDGTQVGTVTSVAGDWALGYVARDVEMGDVVSPAD